MKAWQVILASIVIFLAGAVSGGLLVNQKNQERIHPVTKNPGPWAIQRGDFLRRIERELYLSPEQRERIERILRESHERSKPLWEKVEPQMREEMRQVREKIRAELNSDQQKKFDTLNRARGPGRQSEQFMREDRRKNEPWRRLGPRDGASPPGSPAVPPPASPRN